MLVMIVMVTGLGVLEYFRPAQKIPARHYWFNIRYALTNIAIVSLLSPALVAATSFVTGKLGYGLIDLNFLPVGSWPAEILLVLASLFILDLFQYALHRAEHKNHVMWQEHLLHHSDDFMSATTAARHHFLDSVFATAFIAIPSAALFRLPESHLVAMAQVPLILNYFTHANIRFGLGSLWWLFVTPNYHRIHHADEKALYDSNYAAYFPVIDVLFGTANAPAHDKGMVSGVTGVTIRRVTEAVVLPFANWWAMIRQRNPRDGSIAQR